MDGRYGQSFSTMWGSLWNFISFYGVWNEECGGISQQNVAAFNKRENLKQNMESGLLVDSAQTIIFCCPPLSSLCTYAIDAPQTHTFNKFCLFPFNWAFTRVVCSITTQLNLLLFCLWESLPILHHLFGHQFFEWFFYYFVHKLLVGVRIIS